MVRLRLAKDSFLTQAVFGVSLGELDLATDFWLSPTKRRSRGYLFVRQPVRSYLRQIKFWSAFNVASDQPRLATFASRRPVESKSPPEE